MLNFNTRCQSYIHYYFSLHLLTFLLRQTDWQTHHCACMPISDLTRWQLPNTMTLPYPSSCFSKCSWQASTCALRLLRVHANPCAVICHLQWGTVFLRCILIGFLVKMMVWGGAGFHCDHKQTVSNRFNERSCRTDEDSWSEKERENKQRFEQNRHYEILSHKEKRGSEISECHGGPSSQVGVTVCSSWEPNNTRVLGLCVGLVDF